MSGKSRCRVFSSFASLQVEKGSAVFLTSSGNVWFLMLAKTQIKDVNFTADPRLTLAWESSSSHRCISSSRLLSLEEQKNTLLHLWPAAFWENKYPCSPQVSFFSTWVREINLVWGLEVYTQDLESFYIRYFTPVQSSKRGSQMVLFLFFEDQFQVTFGTTFIQKVCISY